MEKLYCIIVHWAAGTPDVEKIERAINPSGRWLRFSTGGWLYWSTLSSQEIYNIIAPSLTTNESEIIIQTDEQNWYGFAQPWVWNWIKSRGHSLT
jgi:hypothetical protein